MYRYTHTASVIFRALVVACFLNLSLLKGVFAIEGKEVTKYRVTFPKGASHVVMRGYAKYAWSYVYIFPIKGDQKISIKLRSKDKAINFSIFDNPQAKSPIAFKVNSWQGVSAVGPYVIVLVKDEIKPKNSLYEIEFSAN